MIPHLDVWHCLGFFGAGFLLGFLALAWRDPPSPREVFLKHLGSLPVPLGDIPVGTNYEMREARRMARLWVGGEAPRDHWEEITGEFLAAALLFCRSLQPGPLHPVEVMRRLESPASMTSLLERMATSENFHVAKEGASIMGHHKELQAMMGACLVAAMTATLKERDPECEEEA
jgi:hypothetical protein